VKSIESGGLCGFDAGKLIKSRKRHNEINTLGLMVGNVIHRAGVQDQDGAPMVLHSICKSLPWLSHIFVPLGNRKAIAERATDGGYARWKLRDALNG
jgi:putative transposase